LLGEIGVSGHCFLLEKLKWVELPGFATKAAFGGHGSMILVMQEVLSKTDDPKVALRDQEFYELRLYDSDVAGDPVYCVGEVRARWDDEAGHIVWDEEQVQAFMTHQEAKQQYAARRVALVQKGYIYSDMDLF
jgi:hypothetical protein